MILLLMILMMLLMMMYWPSKVKCYQELPTSTSSSTTSSGISTTISSTTPRTDVTTEETMITTMETQATPESTASTGLTTLSPETKCKYEEDEPVSPEVMAKRNSTCMLPGQMVDSVEPGREENPRNVRIVEKVMTEEMFQNSFSK